MRCGSVSHYFRIACMSNIYVRVSLRVSYPAVVKMFFLHCMSFFCSENNHLHLISTYNKSILRRQNRRYTKIKRNQHILWSMVQVNLLTSPLPLHYLRTIISIFSSSSIAFIYAHFG